MDKNIRKIIGAYINKYSLYEDYCNTLRNLLENLLLKHNLKFQISSRIKKLKSLEEKIKIKKEKGKSYKNLNEIEDIAGIRVMFYTDSDRKEFIQLLCQELGCKIKLKRSCKTSGYSATHIIVTLDQNRTKLVEYAKYKTLKCEIQLTSILNHAWAEVEHDIVYKAKEKQIDLRERMKNVMDAYIKKASLEFEKISRRVNNKIKVEEGAVK